MVKNIKVNYSRVVQLTLHRNPDMCLFKNAINNCVPSSLVSCLKARTSVTETILCIIEVFQILTLLSSLSPWGAANATPTIAAMVNIVLKVLQCVMFAGFGILYVYLESVVGIGLLNKIIKYDIIIYINKFTVL